MVEQVREQVRAGGLLAGGNVVVMLSGGRDSVCLLDVAVALCSSDSVTALHVNYGLRPEAEADEAHCRALCRQLGVEIELTYAERSASPRGNVHAWARELRYAAAERMAERWDAAIVAGHTATDQVETILYRLAASPGRRALLGMNASEGRLSRPLLGLTREQTAAYCVERGLDWREDASNDLPRYARARVRHQLLPAFDTIHPAARANLLRTARLLREETELLDSIVAEELHGRQSIALSRLAELAPALARLIVIRLAEDAAGVQVPQAGERVSEILALGRRGGSAELHVGGLLSAVVVGGELRMKRIAPRRQRTEHPG